MSKAIEQFTAERDQKLQKILQEANEHYARLSEEIQEETEVRILEFYRAHPSESSDILRLIKKEIPQHLMAASLEAGREPTPEERKLLERAKTHLDNSSYEKKITAALKDLQPLLFDSQFTYDVVFSDDALRSRFHSVLGSYLDLLKEITPDIFQQAVDFIETCITNKKQLVIKWGAELGVSSQNEKEKKPQILKITTRRAKDAVFGVSKIEGMAFDSEKNDYLYNEEYPVSIWVGTLKKKKVETIVSIDFNEMKKLGVTFTNEQRLNPFDREVHNAAATLYAAGNEYMTPQMIWGALSGNRPDAKMPPEARKKILDSIDKLRHSDIEIDATAEVNVGWNRKATYKGALIPSERVEIININGQEVADCIHLFRNSPLYDYADNKNQVGRVSIKMLNAPISNTPENIELRGYLLREISSMINPKSKLKPIIRYDTLYEYLGITSPSEGALRKKKKEIRDKTKKYLDFWKQEGLIKGYEEEKEGKVIAKVKIKI